MKKHPLLAAGAAAGTAVLGAAYAVYRVAFYQKPTTKVPSPADMPTRECYRKAMGPDADALARDMFKAVHITAQDGTPLAARYYHHADGAPLAIIFHGYRGYAERDGLGGYTLCTALGYNVLLPDQRAHGYSGGQRLRHCGGLRLHQPAGDHPQVPAGVSARHAAGADLCGWTAGRDPVRPL